MLRSLWAELGDGAGLLPVGYQQAPHLFILQFNHSTGHYVPSS